MFVLIFFFDFCSFISVAYTTLNKLLAFFIYNKLITVTVDIIVAELSLFTCTKHFIWPHLILVTAHYKYNWRYNEKIVEAYHNMPKFVMN